MRTPGVTTVALGAAALVLAALVPSPAYAAGASLKVSPVSGTYEVGSTIDVSFLVDTGGEAINAVQADVRFPADKLQVVNPVASTSFISLWATTPTYSNTDGTLSFQGGVPNPGIKTSAGVISTVTFRIKAVGRATLRFAPTSRVLRNDGEGTNILTSTATAEYTLKLPPPSGPIVSSATHPDANVWYNNRHAQFQWEAVDGATGYSIAFDQSPKGIPDDTVDTATTAANMEADLDGVWYFHIRAKGETWGGTTHFPVQIDATPPAAFVPEFERNPITVEDAPILRFLTTDAASGIDHYDVKQVERSSAGESNTLFVEAVSPYTLGRISAGDYRFLVRAFDRAGNATIGTAPLSVVAGGIPFLARVPLLRNPAVANAALVLLALIALVLLVIVLLRRFRLQATFKHDLVALENDARRKASVLQEELVELKHAHDLMEDRLHQTTAPPPVSPPAVPPPAPPAGPPSTNA